MVILLFLPLLSNVGILPENIVAELPFLVLYEYLTHQFHFFYTFSYDYREGLLGTLRHLGAGVSACRVL